MRIAGLFLSFMCIVAILLWMFFHHTTAPATRGGVPFFVPINIFPLLVSFFWIAIIHVCVYQRSYFLAASAAVMLAITYGMALPPYSQAQEKQLKKAAADAAKHRTMRVMKLQGN